MGIRDMTAAEAFEELLKKFPKVVTDGGTWAYDPIKTLNSLLEDPELIDKAAGMGHDRWDKNALQSARCKCGHTYDRHFDGWDHMLDVGCKYCPCFTWTDPTS